MPDLAEAPIDARLSPTCARRVEPSPARRDRLLFADRDGGDRRARDELIKRFLPLARSLARRFEHSGEPLDDLVQVASLALVKAIDRYDPARGYAFSSYAVPTILGELKRHLRNHGWAVRPPRDLQELSLRVDQAASRLSQQLDRAPTPPELAAATDSSDAHVLEALLARRARGAVSLHAPAGGADDDCVLQDTLGISDDGYARAETRVLLDGLMTDVSPRAREVLRLRFCMDLTQAEIGALVGVGEMQISRIVRKTIAQLSQLADAAGVADDTPRPQPTDEAAQIAAALSPMDGRAEFAWPGVGVCGGPVAPPARMAA
ncbi:MAG: polymerase sigma-B factor [Solirubrobacteraceae bacterium]|jgi:RNA polymerase sigma-B factor|nr:polymerase sigma-B factor [Solirubrobacteraceae bacterium]